MNKQQKTILWIGITFFVLAGLFPPQMYPTDGGGYIDRGYSFIFAIARRYRIDAPKLLIQWSIIAAVTGGLLVTLRDDKKS